MTTFISSEAIKNGLTKVQSELSKCSVIIKKEEKEWRMKENIKNDKNHESFIENGNVELTRKSDVCHIRMGWGRVYIF